MLKLFAFLLLCCSLVQAQPTISFQIRNEVRTGTTYEFDVYARGDSSNTFHNRGQIYLNYSPLAFGDSIVENRRIKRPTPLFLLNELSFIGPKYVTLNYVDNTDSRISITWESNFSGIPPLPGAHTRIPTKWTSLYHLEFTMVDTTAEASISFQNNLMASQQFYLFDANDERSYSYKATDPDFFKRAKGRVYWDGNGDSVFNQADIPLAAWIVQATPGPYYAVTDSQGLYTLRLDSGNFNIDIFPPKGRSDFEAYPNTINQLFTKSSADQNSLDFAVKLDSCPLAEVRVFAADHQFCDTNTLYIQYANRGILPLDSVRIALHLPEQISLLSSSHPFGLLSDGSYQFDFPSLAPLTGGVITIKDSTTCSQPLQEKSMCIEASMKPENLCAARDTAWTGSQLAARSSCNAANTDVFFVIENEGTGDMQLPTTYYVIADDSLIYFDQLQLMQGDSLRLMVATRGQSMQLVVKQEDSHPTHHWFSLHHEGCGMPASTGFVSAFAPVDPAHLTRDVICLDFIERRDTSATFATPKGLDSPRYIGDTTELKVGLRFFNPMPNTTDGWISIDSLSPHLDPLGFRPGPVTQPGTLAVYGKGQMILDHYGVELAEAEEVSYFFRISPKSGLAPGTEIFHAAGSCLDTFPSITSDTLLRTIGQGLKMGLSPDRVILNPNSDAIAPGLAEGWKVFPNPTRESVWITSENQAFDLVELWDMMGHRLLQKTFARPEFRFQLALPKLPSGVYLLRVYASEKPLVYRLVVE